MKHANPMAMALLAALQALSLWVLTGMRDDVRGVSRLQGKQGNVISAIAGWAAGHGYKGPQGG